MSTGVMGAFDKVYMKPHRCGYETQSWLRNMDMKDSVIACKILIDDSPCHLFSSDRWYAT
jgi:hypothetical protein